MRERLRRFLAAWAAGALATVGLLPTCIATITVLLLLTMTNGTQVTGVPVVDSTGRTVAVLLGPLLGVTVWLLIGLVDTRFTGADQASPVAYADLSGQVASLRALADGACRDERMGPDDQAPCQAARSHLGEVERLLGLAPPGTAAATGPSWTTGAGYVGTWQRIHRAEEALLSVVPVSTVVAEALYDRSRLIGSTINTRAELLAASVVAVRALDKGAALLIGGAQAAPLGDEVPDPASGRAIIRTIRLTINEFRDSRSAELVRLRRRLTQSTLFTGMTAVSVLLLAIVAGVPIVTILGGVAYYLIGALVGLLQRIQAELDLETSVEDYGLATSRLLLAPLVSGLAAVAGVTLVSVVSGRPFGLYLVEPAADPPGSLLDVFNVIRYPFGLIVAAAFGLAPGILLRRLKTVGDQLKTDLQSSEAAGGPDR